MSAFREKESWTSHTTSPCDALQRVNLHDGISEGSFSAFRVKGISALSRVARCRGRRDTEIQLLERTMWNRQRPPRVATPELALHSSSVLGEVIVTCKCQPFPFGHTHKISLTEMRVLDSKIRRT